MTDAAAAERYLAAFHAGARAGCTARAFARGDLGDGRSSYTWLLDAIDGARRVLDLGCGDGYLLAALAARGTGVRAIGLDLAAGELAAARARLGPGAALVRARAQALPLSAAAVDAVVSHLASMLVPDPEVMFAEVARVLAPGGRFAAIVGGGPPATGREAFAVFLDLVRDHPAVARAPRLGDPRARTLEGWREVMTPCGLEVIELERRELDLAGTAAEVWASLSTMYGIGEAPADERAELATRAELAWAPLAVAGRVPCRMVVWRGIAIRR